MTVLIISLGFLFGLFLQYAKVNTYNSISGMAVLKDFTVAKTIASAIGIGAVLLSIATGLGYADLPLQYYTSGHIISGGMQLAVSSWVFAVFVFAGFLLTGQLFYRKAG